MKTIIVNIPEKDENFFITLFKKFHLKSRIVDALEDEDLMAKWIDEGIDSEQVSKEKVYAHLRKHGVNC